MRRKPPPVYETLRERRKAGASHPACPERENPNALCRCEELYLRDLGPVSKENPDAC